MEQDPEDRPYLRAPEFCLSKSFDGFSLFSKIVLVHFIILSYLPIRASYLRTM